MKVAHPVARRTGQWRTAVVAVLALAGFSAALLQLVFPLLDPTLNTSRGSINGTPYTIYERGRGASATALIAHGFAGSRQLMLPFALTLAHNGYRAVVFDFPGHGQNTSPLGDTADRNDRLDAALQAVRQTVALPEAPVFLVGHSMGSGAVVRAAQATSTDATVALSLITSDTTPDSPRNLLIITGALEGNLRPVAETVVAQVAGGPAIPGTTYGDPGAGTARRMVFPALTEHIGVLYNTTSLRETLGWLDAAQGRTAAADPFIYTPAVWLGLLVISAAALWWVGAQLLPRRVAPLAPGPRTSGWWLAVLLPAILAPLLIWVLPVGNLLPVLVGGPLAAFFAAYGLVTTAALAWTDRAHAMIRLRAGELAAVVALALLFFALVVLTLGVPLQIFALNLAAPPARWWVVLVTALALLPYFVADEWLTRRAGAPRGAYAITKGCFLLALAGAIALDRSLFFLVLIAPLFAVYFCLFGLLSGWLFRRTGTPLIGALLNTMLFAWSIGAVFPLVR